MDRTHVTITVREADAPIVRNLAGRLGLNIDEEFKGGQIRYHEGHVNSSTIPLIEFRFDRVDSEMPELCDAMQAGRIPYDKTWKPFADTRGGTEHFRVEATGGISIQEFYEGDQGMVEITEVWQALSNGVLEDFLRDRERRHTVMSWEDQEKALASREAQLARGHLDSTPAFQA